MLRAAESNLSAGGVREGGGTITMQLARNTILTSERTLRRKLKEVFLALRLEREFSKEEILTLYLNRIFLGQRAYGIGAAAQVYFDKSARSSRWPRLRSIAGLPRSPSRDNPVASVERAAATVAPTCCAACSRPARSTQGARRGGRGAGRRPHPRPVVELRRRTSRRWSASRWSR